MHPSYTCYINGDYRHMAGDIPHIYIFIDTVYFYTYIYIYIIYNIYNIYRELLKSSLFVLFSRNQLRNSVLQKSSLFGFPQAECRICI